MTVGRLMLALAAALAAAVQSASITRNGVPSCVLERWPDRIAA
jgi:hypothetical protein